ncbi:hypothetical protein M9Y10_038712 [Tritrichomonas musculus]|uniref:Protein kinase domain-containing protein n=1 Tax=Tritrichomonas musculus TaxID=1915356 RepID=A0ABR2K984_9EUKA
MSENTFDLNKFELLEKIGSGSFGDVYKAKEKRTGKIYAAKISNQSIDQKDTPRSVIRNLVREVNILSKLNHPSILSFVGFSLKNFNGEPNPVIITDYLPKGTLNDLIKLERQSTSDEKWNDTQKLIIIYGIASAMSYLHSHNIIHRDLKPDNILVDDNLNPKIADFGLSKINQSDQTSSSMVSTLGLKGTIAYIPPEILNDYDYTKEGDVYAFSMIVYEIMTNIEPFKNCGMSTLISKVSKGIRPDLDQPIPESYKNLIEKCWSQDPSNRPSFEEIVKELKSDSGFITDLVDEGQYQDYVDYIDEYKVTFDKEKKILSFDEFVKRKNKKNDPDAQYRSQFEAIVNRIDHSSFQSLMEALEGILDIVEKANDDEFIEMMLKKSDEIKNEAAVSLANERSDIIKLANENGIPLSELGLDDTDSDDSSSDDSDSDSDSDSEEEETE